MYRFGEQLISDVPIATFLSGGLDSSIITAIGAMEMKKKGERLSTYSFDYEDNNKYFKASHFQPDSDTKWVPRLVEALNTNHTYLVCPNNVLTELLEEALLAKDLPEYGGRRRVTAVFLSWVKKNRLIVLSGNVRTKYSAVIHGLGRKKRF